VLVTGDRTIIIIIIIIIIIQVRQTPQRIAENLDHYSADIPKIKH